MVKRTDAVYRMSAWYAWRDLTRPPPSRAVRMPRAAADAAAIVVRYGTLYLMAA